MVTLPPKPQYLTTETLQLKLSNKIQNELNKNWKLLAEFEALNPEYRQNIHRLFFNRIYEFWTTMKSFPGPRLDVAIKQIGRAHV